MILTPSRRTHWRGKVASVTPRRAEAPAGPAEPPTFALKNMPRAGMETAKGGASRHAPRHLNTPESSAHGAIAGGRATRTSSLLAARPAPAVRASTAVL